MSFLNLLPDEMVGISGPMIDPTSEAHVIIIAYDEELKAPYKRLAAAHAAVSKAAQPAKPERIKEIILAQGKLDARHDAIIRGVWGLFGALAELLGGDEGATLLVLRDHLVPNGLSSQNKTYGGEAGQAALLAERMTAEVRQRTDSIVIGEGAKAKTLTACIDEWISLGAQLGAYEGERGQIENAPSDGADLHNARLDWSRAQNAMVSNAEMAGLTPKEMATLFGALWTAERKADDRAAAAKAQAAAEVKAAMEEKAAEEKAAAEKAAAPG